MPEPAQQGRTLPVPAAVGGLRDATEPDDGVSPGVIGARSSGHLFVDVELHVAVEFFSDRPVAPVRAHAVEESPSPRANAIDHEASSGARNRATMAVVWSHSLAARSSRRRPARVSV